MSGEVPSRVPARELATMLFAIDADGNQHACGATVLASWMVHLYPANHPTGPAEDIWEPIPENLRPPNVRVCYFNAFRFNQWFGGFPRVDVTVTRNGTEVYTGTDTHVLEALIRPGDTITRGSQSLEVLAPRQENPEEERY